MLPPPTLRGILLPLSRRPVLHLLTGLGWMPLYSATTCSVEALDPVAPSAFATCTTLPCLGDIPTNSCNIGTFLTITSAVNSPVPCPSGAGSRLCSRYDIQFQWHGVNPSVGLVSVSVDLGIRQVRSSSGFIMNEPCQQDSTFKVGGACGEPLIRLTSNPTTYF